MPDVVLMGLGGLYGALDEWHQSFVPGRTPDATDWLADVAGVIAGYSLASLVGRSRAGRATG